MTERPQVWINEVVARDGFQAETMMIPTEHKIAIIDGLSASGVAKIEVTSFVSARAIPQLADAESVMRGITRNPQVRYAVLVPNRRGADRALMAAPDEFNLVMSASPSHNRANLGMEQTASFDTLRAAIDLAHSARIDTQVSLSCCFGCPYEGDMETAQVMRWCEAFIDLGVAGITLCDTTGMAYPTQVRAVVDTFRNRWPDLPLCLHFHDTRGLGSANVMAALQSGVRRFDSSLGGLGGCPYAPGATGNVCSEDIAHLLELEGYDTGVNLDQLIDCARALRRLLAHELPGQLHKSGPRWQRRA